MFGESLFEETLSVPPGERAAFLDQKCQGQPELRAAVDALLANHDESSHFLEEPLFVRKPPESPAPYSEITSFISSTAPTVVIAGRYTMLEKIGEGGMGEVWVAKQTEPIKRRVALKLIKTGMDSKAVLARFEQERQALALMDHPNIARVLDGGMTAAGLPFFVMELVNGLPLNKYCDEARLAPKERLELFVKVCQAVQHAHQKGIIHRDLKPANILVGEVDGNPVPKVIDFGVAKATAGKLTDESMFTQFGAVVGTLEYMAPEQAGVANEDIDTRADIYSLGVILYELLTGLKPIDAKRLKSTALLEMIRVIKEVDPAKPSTRLSTDAELPAMAANRQTDPKKLTALLRGDLDCVVMKCLEKNRSRRYDTANGLATDIKRHLAHEPVIARPPSTAYRLQKAWQRNKLACSAAGAVAAALLIGITVSVSQAVRADREATRSAAALNELRATAPAFAEQAHGLASKEQFDDAIEKLDYAIKLRPDVPEYLVTKGDMLQCQFKLAAAAANYREALRIKPGVARAEASAKLCDELLAAKPGEQGKLSRESLAKLHLAIQEQQRPTAELMPVARLLGEAKKHLLDYWLARLKDLPVSTEKPLKERLTIRDGELNPSWDPVVGSGNFEVQVNTDPTKPAQWLTKLSSSQSHCIIHGLPSGVRHWVRVRANGPMGPGPWSDEASKMVP
ncbi:MAG: protein kinase [Planctomycetota bacterium]